MSLTQEKRYDNFTNNNDHSYLHKKFKRMASTSNAFPTNQTLGEKMRKETIVGHTNCTSMLPNGSIAAAHPEIQKIKKNDVENYLFKDEGIHVQIKFNHEHNRLSETNNVVQVSGQTSFNNELSNKTEILENDFVREPHNGGTSGRYICPYCKLSCAKPSVLQKHIRAHTNERPFPCEPCGFAFKTKSNLYKHRRSRTHALRLQGSDVSSTINEEDLSGDSESDSSLQSIFMSETGIDSLSVRLEGSRPSEISSPDSAEDLVTSINIMTGDGLKSKTIYKPKFRAAFYQENTEKDKLMKNISPNAEFLNEHISKIISDNEAIVDVIETPLQKKYGKIKQIAESKQLFENSDPKFDSSPLNLTKSSNDTEISFRKRSHSESFSQTDFQKHPLNPEGSIIKNLLLKNKVNGKIINLANGTIDGPYHICPSCQTVCRSADLEVHTMFYCKSNNVADTCTPADTQCNTRPGNIYMRSNSINVRLPENSTNNLKLKSPSNSPPLVRNKPDNLIIHKSESLDVITPLPSPGPLLGNTRLIDTRTPEYKQKENCKARPLSSPKIKIINRTDAHSPRIIENVSPRTMDLYQQSKLRCNSDRTSSGLRSMEELSSHMRQNSTSLQMFGGEVKIIDHSGSTTTLRIEPSKNQLSPILVHPNISPSKLANEAEASSVVVRSGLHSGGTIVHNPPTPKEIITTPQTPRINISSISAVTNANVHNIHDIPHFQFPPFNAITAFNPLTLPPLSPASSPNGATTILHGGKLIPHVPGIPGPNTQFIGNSLSSKNNELNRHNYDPLLENIQHNTLTKSATITRYDSADTPVTSKHSVPISEYHKQSIQLRIEVSQTSPVPTIHIKNVDDHSSIPKTTPENTFMKPEGALKRDSDGLLKNNLMSNRNRNIIDKSSNPVNKFQEVKCETDIRHFNFENLITKTEIYNNQVSNCSETQNDNGEESSHTLYQSERSETSYFQKNTSIRSNNEEQKYKFLRPTTLPLKPGTFTPKRHHGITPNANTMPLVSPETPRPAKAYGQLYLNGNAYTYLGLKCSTKAFYCTINRPQPTYVPNQHFLSMYSNWQLLSELTPDPLGLSASSAMSLYDSRHRPQNVAMAVIKQDLILTHSSQWNKNSKENKQVRSLESKKSEDNKTQLTEAGTTPKKELTGGFESNEEYTYVRGRGRGRYVCSECGIRCKKPSMLKKHIRTHTDVRPYTCKHCAFSFKTKGNLTKHMKSKAHYKKCCELGINPNEGNEAEGVEAMQCSGETDDESESDGDEGLEGETESSDTEVCKSRLPEHEAAHCLLSLGSERQSTKTTPGLITSARPSTYPYMPKKSDTGMLVFSNESFLESNTSAESKMSDDSEPMDLSKNDVKYYNNSEIPTARESSVLASLASNTAKLPQHSSQWVNGEHLLHTYLTERALLDTKIKQSQLTTDQNKTGKLDKPVSADIENETQRHNNNNNTITTTNAPLKEPRTKQFIFKNEDSSRLSPAFKEEKITVINSETVINANTLQKKSLNNNGNAENAKQVVSEYLKQARINLIKTRDENVTSSSNNNVDVMSNVPSSQEDIIKTDEITSEDDSVNMSSIEQDTVARKVVIGVGGVEFKVSRGKEYENTSSYSTGRLMEDGHRVCDFCNKTFTKPSQLRLHLNIHYMERPFRCNACAVSFRTRGHLQKHERSGSHHNKVSMTSTFGAATSSNPRPFICRDCDVAFRIHGHLAKHLRSKMHVMRLECLFKLPFGTFTEIERAGVSLTDIDTTDCASSLASLQSLARKLHEKDPTKLEYRDPLCTAAATATSRECSENEDGFSDKIGDSERDGEIKSDDCVEGLETKINYSATDN